jgi:ribosomal protein S18 acetylase RimI-like enzyme
MQFELTEALIDDILFSMEDQNGEFFMDTQDGMVAGGEGLENSLPGQGSEGRYIPLPEWDSAAGFRLMERFAAGFRNPPVREKLTAALGRGRGVFRAFKDVLNLHPEAEQLWFNFKEQEMRRVVFNWYNALREEWGLDRIGGEPEETEDLVLEDFRFRAPVTQDASAVAALHRACTEAAGFPPGVRAPQGLSARSFSREPQGEPVLTAESGSNDFAGYIAVARTGEVLHITALEVKPEYRGLGVGEALLTRFLETLDPGEVSDIVIDLPVEVEGFSRVLVREHFEPDLTRYRLRAEKRQSGSDR